MNTHNDLTPTDTDSLFPEIDDLITHPDPESSTDLFSLTEEEPATDAATTDDAEVTDLVVTEDVAVINDAASADAEVTGVVVTDNVEDAGVAANDDAASDDVEVTGDVVTDDVEEANVAAFDDVASEDAEVTDLVVADDVVEINDAASASAEETEEVGDRGVEKHDSEDAAVDAFDVVEDDVVSVEAGVAEAAVTEDVEDMGVEKDEAAGAEIIVLEEAQLSETNSAGTEAADEAAEGAADEAEADAVVVDTVVVDTVVVENAAVPVRVADVVAVMDQAYPPHLAESWDRVGLICGDPEDAVTTVAFALEATDSSVAAAIDAGAQMLIVHHPLLMRGVNTVAANSPKGRVIHKLIRAGIALFAAHTNADSARPGVNDALAELLGVTPGRPIAPRATGTDRWAVMVPATHVESVKNAMFAAGAGGQGDYTECAFTVTGTGQFHPQAGANPFITHGELTKVEELRVSMIAPSKNRGLITRALKESHPYEEPAYEVTALANDHTDLETAYGLGRIGELDTPMTLKEFTQRVADRLPTTVWGVRAVGDPDRIIRTVAVSSGSGDSFLETVATLDVDVYVTSDLRHHPVDEYLRLGDNLPAVVDTAHWSSESPWLDQAAGVVATLGVNTLNLQVRTDPWTIHAQSN